MYVGRASEVRRLDGSDTVESGTGYYQHMTISLFFPETICHPNNINKNFHYITIQSLSTQVKHVKTKISANVMEKKYFRR